MKQVRAKVDTLFLTKGKCYWVARSDFMGGCWHIYAAPDTDAWMFNIFSEKEYKERLEEI